jgi:(p)ppGpp synthase/HD superfamily hydrolase
MADDNQKQGQGLVSADHLPGPDKDVPADEKCQKIPWRQGSYLRAYRFAAEAHQDQLFPGSDLPYLLHISFVSMEVMAALTIEKDRDGGLAVQCALLHDVLEDTPTSYEEICSGFGLSVAQGVLALTKNRRLEKHKQMTDSLDRIRQQPDEVWMVKLADRITNLAPPPHYWTKDRIAGYREEAILIYEVLHSASPYLGSRLLQKIDQYQGYI